MDPFMVTIQYGTCHLRLNQIDTVHAFLQVISEAVPVSTWIDFMIARTGDESWVEFANQCLSYLIGGV